jgi:hypothetical protein
MQIEVVRSAKYYKAYKKNTPLVLATVEKALPFLKQEFPLVDFSKVQVTIRPIKGPATGTARTVWGTAKIDIDCRMNNVKRILDTLAHEITHAEQYQTKRLQLDRTVREDGDYRLCHVWVEDGQEQKFPPNCGSTYKAYRALPWEVEAFARGEAFANKYAERIAG